MSNALPYCYRAYGLHVRSELKFPELLPASSNGTPAENRVTVGLGEVPSLSGSPSGGAEAENGVYYATDEHVTFAFPEVGRFHVRNGKEIVVDPAPGAEEAALRLFVLGVSMGTLLHQRGLLVLHASAVAIDGGAVLFVGKKGQGKSTMAAALEERGHPLLTDDVAAISLAQPDAPLVYPGFPQLKLWPESAASIGKNPEALPRLYEKVEKRVQRVEGYRSGDALPLQTLFVLDHGSPLRADPLSTQEAFGQVVRHSYLTTEMMQLTRTAQRHFNQCTELLRSVSPQRLVRPQDLSQIARVVRFVEEQCSPERTHIH